MRKATSLVHSSVYALPNESESGPAKQKWRAILPAIIFFQSCLVVTCIVRWLDATYVNDELLRMLLRAPEQSTSSFAAAPLLCFDAATLSPYVSPLRSAACAHHGAEAQSRHTLY